MITGQLVSYAPNSYGDRTSRPVYALVFLLFFLAVFVLGTLLIQPEALRQSLAEPQIRVASFIWIQDIMRYLGFSTRGALFASPLVVIILLLALQTTSRTSWRINMLDLPLMGLETIALSIPLLVLTMLLNRAAAPAATIPAAAGPPVQDHYFTDIVTGIGAGIFEELIFRLILICLLMLIFQDFIGLSKKTSVIIAVLVSSILFSVSHHLTWYQGSIVQTPDPFTVGKFIFRFLAGIYFAVLYATRGYGITAGTHAVYNILAALTRMFLVIGMQSPS